MKSNFKVLLFLTAVYLLNQGVFLNGQAGSGEQQIDQIFASWNNPSIPGVSVAVVRDGHIVFSKGYGCANLEYGIPVSASTVFHVASVSKQVTAFAILLLKDEGKLSLDDDIRKFIPELPEYEQVITIKHLLWHTSGLRDQFHLLSMAGWRLDDVITTQQVLDLICRQKHLNFAPGEEYMYSNTGYTLLAEVVSRISGQTFADFTLDRIFRPLKMTHTLFYDDHEKIVSNRAYSYHPDGNTYEKSVLNYAMAGATSLFTTAEDLCLWTLNFENPVVGNKSLIQEMNQRGVLNNGDTISYALGQDIGIYKGLRYISHGGADAGYRAFVGRFPDQRFSVIICSNNASFDPEGTALKVADIYLANYYKADKPAEAVESASIASTFSGDTALFKAYAGQYELRPGFIIDIQHESGQLFIEAHEVPKTRMVQISETEFEIPVINARIAFIANDNNEISHMDINLNGQRFTARKSQSDPLTVIVTEYCGDYYSPELGAIYSFKSNKGRLTAVNNRLGELTLEAVGQDRFGAAMYFMNNIEFIRDQNHVITGCNVSGIRLRDIQFVKIGLPENP